MIATIVSSDWIWVALIVVVLFGGSQLPKLARNAGDAMKEFRKAHAEASEPIVAGPQATPAPQASAQPQMAYAPSPLPAGIPSAVAPVPAAPATNDNVTLTRAQLDALLAEREAQGRATVQPPAAQA